jgi:hypothetical protein
MEATLVPALLTASPSLDGHGTVVPELAIELWIFAALVSPSKECPARETDDAAVVVVVFSVRPGFFGANETDFQKLGIARIFQILKRSLLRHFS